MDYSLGINGRFLSQPLTGVQRYARCWVKALDHLLISGEIAGSDWQVTLYVPRGQHIKPGLGKLNLQAIQIKQVGFSNGYFWEQLELPLYARDQVLINLGNMAPILSLISPQKTVVTIHDLSFQKFPESYSRLYQLTYNLLTPLIMARADAMLTVSQTEAKAILDVYPQAKSRLYPIPNGHWPDDLDLEAIAPMKPIGRPFMLAVGTLSARKNLTGILKAAEQVNQQKSLDFVMVGGRPSIYQAIQLELPTSLKDRVHFVGTVDDRTLISYYKAAQGLVYPSFYEASGLPPLEAMACGCPVIVSDIPALKERCQEAAIYCQASSPETIAEAIIKLINHPELQRELRRKGYEQAQALTWKNSVQQAMKVIASC
ncbi:glycosyltransferase family 1 protein [Thermosynechococcaceae cyanobacterium BACA0444]|uniref:Glycosyltransferase family 1 protein n=1 Tax=Pseudocalidococcus azoricus BACA0444 TaxID=2918990 RepID=A0AAE4FQT2_9CYAN|nr:glycosyltransferase family 1 protein [Pseudocalidococcus azoricus]MDS3860569.1 glycosyltransferase family 1 protein [Pseudocalidococcus azoricus BACA0444]